jgi:hypothetical protein
MLRMLLRIPRISISIFLGTPTLDELYAITTNLSLKYMGTLVMREGMPFGNLFPHASEDLIDFLSNTLVRYTMPRLDRRFTRRMLGVKPGETANSGQCIAASICRSVCSGRNHRRVRSILNVM